MVKKSGSSKITASKTSTNNNRGGGTLAIKPQAASAPKTSTKITTLGDA